MNHSVFMPMLMNAVAFKPENTSTTQQTTTEFKSIFEGVLEETSSVTNFDGNETLDFDLEPLKADLLILFLSLQEDEALMLPEQFNEKLSVQLEQLFTLSEEQLGEVIDELQLHLVESNTFEQEDSLLERLALYFFQTITQKQRTDNYTPSFTTVDYQKELNKLAKLLELFMRQEYVKEDVNQVKQTVRLDSKFLTILNQLAQLDTNQMTSNQSNKWNQLLEQITQRFQATNGQANINQLIQQVVQKVLGNEEGNPIQRNHPSFLSVHNVNHNIHLASPLSQMEQYSIFINQTNHSSGTSTNQQLLNQLQQIVHSSRFGKLGSSNQLTVQLKPANLGDMVIRFTQIDGQLTVKMIVSTQAAKELLESNLNQLRHLFSPNQVVIERQATESNAEQMNYTDQDSEQHNKEQHQQQLEQDSKEEEQSTMSFKDYLFQEEV